MEECQKSICKSEYGTMYFWLRCTFLIVWSKNIFKKSTYFCFLRYKYLYLNISTYLQVIQLEEVWWFWFILQITALTTQLIYTFPQTSVQEKSAALKHNSLHNGLTILEEHSQDFLSFCPIISPSAKFEQVHIVDHSAHPVLQKTLMGHATKLEHSLCSRACTDLTFLFIPVF